MTKYLLSILCYKLLQLAEKVIPMVQSSQHFENRSSPSGLVGQEMKWTVKCWGSPHGLVGQEMKLSVKRNKS